MKLSFEHISKLYGDTAALQQMDLTLGSGVYCFLCKNGAGKTTLMRIMTDLLAPSTGRVLLDGQDIAVMGAAFRKKLGYLPQDFGVYPNFTAEQFLLYIARLKGLSKFEAKRQTDGLLHMVGLEDKKQKKLKDFSGGQRQRVGIAQALLGDPEILVLDEPTNDLDIVTLGVLEEYLQAFKGCVIVVSHDRYFVDKVADHLLVFCGGGEIREFAGTYSDYTAWKRDYEAAKQAAVAQEKAKSAASGNRGGEIRKSGTAPAKTGAARKLTFQEKREMERLEAEIPELEQEKAAIEEKLSSGDLPFEELTALSERITALMDQIDTKSMRWLELSEIGG